MQLMCYGGQGQLGVGWGGEGVIVATIYEDYGGYR